MAGAEVEPRQRDDGFVAFHASGTRIVGAFHCSDCGYGIVSRGVLPACPMVRGATWEESSWRPFTGEAPPR